MFVLDEPLADGFFLVGAGIARAAGGGPGVEDDGGAAKERLKREW